MPAVAKKPTTKKVTAKAVEKKAKAPKEPKEPKEKGLGLRKEATLSAMKSLGGKGLSHAQIAEVTGRTKGNQLRELTELGLVSTENQEGVRGHTFNLTPEGRKVAAKIK